MAVINNGLPKTKLKAIDIRDTLNANGGKTNNKTSSFFKEDANINKWSKHKPIVTGVKNDIFVPFDSEKWNNQSGDVPKRVNDYVSAWNGCSVDDWYTYRLPKGGEDEPLRKGDFRGYRADATPPFKAFTIEDAEADHVEVTGNSTTCKVYIRNFLNNENDPQEGGMLSLKDLDIFNKLGETYRIAVVDKFIRKGGSESSATWDIYKGSELTEHWVESVVTLKTWTVNDVGTHELAPVLVSDNGNYIPLPFPHRKLKIAVWYTGDAFIEFSASFQYGYADVPNSGEFSVGFTYVQATPYDETKDYNVQIYYGTSSSPIDVIMNNTFKITGEDTTEAGQHCYKASSHQSLWRINSSHWAFSACQELWNNDNLYAWFGLESVKAN